MWLFRNIVFYLANFAVFQFSCANYLTGDVIWYSHEIFLICTGVLFLLMLVKLRNKWTGIITLNRRQKKYGIFYTAPLSRKFLGWTWLFYGIEAIVSLVFPLVYLFMDIHTWPFAVLLFINGTEGLLYLYMNTRQGNFRLGINENAVVHNARGTYVLPFHGLKSVVHRYDEYFFIYLSGETLTIPEYIVDPEYLPDLRRHITRLSEERGVFVTEKLREK